MRTTLNQNWILRAVGGDIPPALAALAIPATVPGCVHLDLMAAGLIPDPYLDDNEAALAWIGRVDWQYETTFEWQPDGQDQTDLVALGLDTVASIELNGTVIGRTQNMHRSYRFPVVDRMVTGTNKIAVRFEAGLTAAERLSAELGPRPFVNTHPFNAIRKMASNYGWDWGPDLVTAGIWRPCYLESWSTARLAAVRPLVEVAGSTGIVHAHIEVQRDRDEPLEVLVQVAGKQHRVELAPGQNSTVVEVSVPEVDLWWPTGYGDQPLYPVVVTLSDRVGELDTWHGRVGFRTIELDTSADVDGTAFALSVNGIALFARGVNWIPEDTFPARMTQARYVERLTQARDANVNLVRVWGGGLYESEDFYTACDELGLLVWQDFLFACAAYAEEEPLRSEVIAEAREAVTRLSPHPSLALWNGCNENIWGYADWDWQQPLAGRSWGWAYYSEILPAIVAELDPTRLYTPGSPYSMSPDRHPNDPAHGTMHIWDVWNQRDYTAYRDYRPRFCAEFGFQGPPAWTTLIDAVHDRPLTPQSPGVLVHQKAEDGNDKLTRGLAGHLPAPASTEDWHWATSLNQARAVAFGIEHFRSWRPLCMGAIVWQLNDCWPVISWAAIDGAGRRKPLWYALRRSFADRLLTLQPRPEGLSLIAVNDCAERWSGNVEFTRRSFDGSMLAKASMTLDVAARGISTIPVPPDLTAAVDPAAELLIAEAGDERTIWPFAEDVDSALPAPELDADLEPAPGGYRLTVRAHTLLRDLSILADRIAPDAMVDDLLVTLFPGESKQFLITTQTEVKLATVLDPMVLRSANQLLHQELDLSPAGLV